MTRLDELLRMQAFIEAEIARERARTAPAYSRLIHAVADLYGIAPEFLLSPDERDIITTRARQALCWALRETGLSLPGIGRIVGRDHTTVLQACRTIEKDSARRALIRQLLDADQSVAS